MGEDEGNRSDGKGSDERRDKDSELDPVREETVEPRDRADSTEGVGQDG